MNEEKRRERESERARGLKGKEEGCKGEHCSATPAQRTCQSGGRVAFALHTLQLLTHFQVWLEKLKFSTLERPSYFSPYMMKAERRHPATLRCIARRLSFWLGTRQEKRRLGGRRQRKGKMNVASVSLRFLSWLRPSLGSLSNVFFLFPSCRSCVNAFLQPKRKFYSSHSASQPQILLILRISLCYGSFFLYNLIHSSSWKTPFRVAIPLVASTTLISHGLPKYAAANEHDDHCAEKMWYIETKRVIKKRWEFQRRWRCSFFSLFNRFALLWWTRK